MDIENQIEMVIDCQIKESKLENIKKARFLEQIINIKPSNRTHKVRGKCDMISKSVVPPRTDRKREIVKVGSEPS
tara:strand:+ start:387 stop:611 length:225 start_codon:yes stop_codon:yes gene_type:complete